MRDQRLFEIAAFRNEVITLALRPGLAYNSFMILSQLSSGGEVEGGVFAHFEDSLHVKYEAINQLTLGRTNFLQPMLSAIISVLAALLLGFCSCDLDPIAFSV